MIKTAVRNGLGPRLCPHCNVKVPYFSNHMRWHHPELCKKPKEKRYPSQTPEARRAYYEQYQARKKAEKANNNSLLPDFSTQVLSANDISVPQKLKDKLNEVKICPRCLTNIMLLASAMGGDPPVQCPKCRANLLAVGAALDMPIKNYLE